MPKLTNVSKTIMVAVIAVVVIVFVIVYTNTSGTPAGTNSGYTNTTSGAAVTAASPTQTQNPAPNQKNGTTGGTTSAPKVPAPAIKMITPVANDLWKIGTQNLISWSKAGGITGSISLINVATKQTAGVILPQVGPNQTSYTWNTRDLLLDRTSPFKKDVAPGTYTLKIIFDGNNIPPITSPSFTITN